VLADLKGRHNEEDQDIFEEVYEESMTPQLKDFKCPYDKRTVENGGLYAEDEIVYGSSYSMNMTNFRPQGGWAVRDRLYSLQTDQVVKPAEKIHFMDGQWFVVYAGGAAYKEVWDLAGDVMSADIHGEWDAASYRHSEGANITFYDGHVEYWPKEKVYPYVPGLLEQFMVLKKIWYPIPSQGEFWEP
jgi:prepilin-type processing-associated H-X9-DG protein